MNKIKIIALVLLLQTAFASVGQEEDVPSIYKYWVELNSKEVDKYSVDKPKAFLTQRAIDRRSKQNIAILEQDFPVNEEFIKKINSDFNAAVLSRSRWFNALIIETYDDEVIKDIKELAFVKSIKLLGKWDDDDGDEEEEDAEKDSAYYANLDAAVENYDEPRRKSYVKYTSISDLKSGIYGDAQTQIKIMNGIKLHDMGYKGEGMVIAILDAGFLNVNTMPQFDSLRKNGQILGTKDLVEFDDDVYKDDNHGMNVLSCMGANIPGVIVGTAPKASYWLIRTEDNGTEFPVEEANWVVGAE